MLIPKAGVLKAHGQTIETDPSAKQSVIETDTLQCVHCGMHWRVVIGSGRQRGFCRNCMGPSCGKQACTEKCVPWEKQMDISEAEARLIIRP